MFKNCFINFLIKSWTVRSILAIRVQINGILWSNFWTLLFQTRFVPCVRFVFKLTAFCEAIFEHYCFKHCSFHSIRVLQNAVESGEECDGFAIIISQIWRKFRDLFKIFVIKLSTKDSYVSNYIYFCTANQVPHIVGDAVWKLQIIRYIPVHEAFLSHDNAAFFICLCRWGGLFFCALASGFPFQQLLIF